MRTVFLAIVLCAAACTRTAAPPPTAWTTGFWFWQGSSSGVKTRLPLLDVLYVQAGTLQPESMSRDRWNIYGGLPDELPPARAYWLVYRLDAQELPPPQTAEILRRKVQEARRRKLPVAGVQLDIDSPTGKLKQYAGYLHAVRQALGPQTPLSITALLDWFRPGTEIESVIAAVDEFVPQFYDLENPNSSGGTPIAAPIVATKWAPIFNRFEKRFRIGVSVFGRTRFVPRPQDIGGHPGIVFYGLTQLDISVNPAFSMTSTTTPAQETIVTYRVVHPTSLSHREFIPGEAIEFTFATDASIRAAVDQAKRMGRYCAGVLFFRWPTQQESIATTPDSVLAAAAILPPPLDSPASLRVIQGDCAVVHCADLYLLKEQPVSPQRTRYRVNGTVPFEYFLPNEKVPVRLAGPGAVTISVPPFAGRRRLFLGRAVTLKPSTFTVEEAR